MTLPEPAPRESATAGAANDDSTALDVVTVVTVVIVVTVGEAMVLFNAQQVGPLDPVEAHTRGTAGAELKVAIGLARIGLRVADVSRLGRDSFGRYLAASMQREGLDGHHVAFEGAHPTGFMRAA